MRIFLCSECKIYWTFNKIIKYSLKKVGSNVSTIEYNQRVLHTYNIIQQIVNYMHKYYFFHVSLNLCTCILSRRQRSWLWFTIFHLCFKRRKKHALTIIGKHHVISCVYLMNTCVCMFVFRLLYNSEYVYACVRSINKIYH